MHRGRGGTIIIHCVIDGLHMDDGAPADEDSLADVPWSWLLGERFLLR